MTIAMVLAIVNDQQVVDEEAQLRPVRVSIGASPEDGSISLLTVIFVTVFLVLARADTKAFFADLAVFL
jgi:hypothetical protein